MLRERIYALDWIRVLACLMVIFMHAPISTAGVNSLFLLSNSYLTAPCIGLFFMVSGALLLPVKMPTKVFFRKRFLKVCIPVFVWSIFYLLLFGDSTENFVQHVLSIPFSAQGTGVLWFMYALMGLYLFAPILSKWLEKSSKKELEFYLFLWSITLCYPLLKGYFDVNDSNTGPLYYFSGYAGYFLLGYYVNKFYQNIRIKYLLFPLLLSLAAPVVCKVMQWEVNFYEVFWYLSIFVAIQCVTWFVIIRKNLMGGGDKLNKFMVKTSNLSFGIYLMHIFFMRSIIWKWDKILAIQNYILQTVIVFTLTLIFSFVACYLVSLLPFGDYIIGYKQKK